MVAMVLFMYCSVHSAPPDFVNTPQPDENEHLKMKVFGNNNSSANPLKGGLYSFEGRKEERDEGGETSSSALFNVGSPTSEAKV